MDDLVVTRSVHHIYEKVARRPCAAEPKKLISIVGFDIWETVRMKTRADKICFVILKQQPPANKRAHTQNEKKNDPFAHCYSCSRSDHHREARCMGSDGRSANGTPMRAFIQLSRSQPSIVLLRKRFYFYIMRESKSSCGNDAVFAVFF